MKPLYSSQIELEIYSLFKNETVSSSRVEESKIKYPFFSNVMFLKTELESETLLSDIALSRTIFELSVFFEGSKQWFETFISFP